MTVEWSSGPHYRTAHLYQDRRDYPAEQREARTSLSHDGLSEGNLSLKLSSVQLSDSGRYRCFFHAKDLQSRCFVSLTVAEDKVSRHKQQAAGSDDKTHTSISIKIGIGTFFLFLVVIIFIAACCRGVDCGGLAGCLDLCSCVFECVADLLEES
ncbi:myelin-oligodendrocyte glycoprotein-like [Trachinotus anak]|uniref:myelin-oligodendrocyte glycoprotein-like n=1 Tax=Trachinotus anak TaxID=443729 RepID=UPI0039F229C9